jgi:hypothetical protein
MTWNYSKIPSSSESSVANEEKTHCRCRDIAEAEMLTLTARKHLDPTANMHDDDREEATRNIIITCTASSWLCESRLHPSFVGTTSYYVYMRRRVLNPLKFQT